MTRTAVPLHDTPVRLIAGHHGPLAVADSGADGAAALFVPGYTGSKEDFGPLFEPLANASFRALAFDQRGQYESPSPAGAAHHPVALAADVIALVEKLGLRNVHLVGHSFGGLVARAAVIAAPHVFASLVLMDSGPAALPAGPRVAAMQLLRPVLLDDGIDAVWSVYESTGTATEFARRRFLAQDPRALLEMGDALLAEPDRTDELRAACEAHSLPVLVLCGHDDDAWPPPLQRRMAERLAARFATIPGAAHSPAVEEPAQTARTLIDFWRGDQCAGEDSVTTS